MSSPVPPASLPWFCPNNEPPKGSRWFFALTAAASSAAMAVNATAAMLVGGEEPHTPLFEKNSVLISALASGGVVFMGIFILTAFFDGKYLNTTPTSGEKTGLRTDGPTTYGTAHDSDTEALIPNPQSKQLPGPAKVLKHIGLPLFIFSTDALGRIFIGSAVKAWWLWLQGGPKSLQAGMSPLEIAAWVGSIFILEFPMDVMAQYPEAMSEFHQRLYPDTEDSWTDWYKSQFKDSCFFTSGTYEWYATHISPVVHSLEHMLPNLIMLTYAIWDNETSWQFYLKVGILSIINLIDFLGLTAEALFFEGTVAQETIQAMREGVTTKSTKPKASKLLQFSTTVMFLAAVQHGLDDGFNWWQLQTLDHISTEAIYFLTALSLVSGFANNLYSECREACENICNSYRL